MTLLALPGGDIEPVTSAADTIDELVGALPRHTGRRQEALDILILGCRIIYSLGSSST